MGRIKGVKMTEEAKMAMRVKREANRLGKESAFVTVWDNLVFLNYVQLEAVMVEAGRLINEKREKELQQLIKMKENIESKLKELAAQKEKN